MFLKAMTIFTTLGLLSAYVHCQASTETSEATNPGERKHDGCEITRTEKGVFISCVKGGKVTTSELYDGMNGQMGPPGEKGDKGDTGSRGSPGEGLPDETISWCHHNETGDHRDVQLYIPLAEFLLGHHQGWPHGFDYYGKCAGGCTCDYCEPYYTKPEDRRAPVGDPYHPERAFSIELYNRKHY